MSQEKKTASLTSLLLRLFQHVSRRRRIQFFGMLGLTLVSSFAEVVSLGSVLPFIGILTQPERVLAHPFMAGFVHILGISAAVDLILPLTVVFVAAALLAGGVRLLLLWVSVKIGNAIGADLGIAMYRRTLYQPYPVHVARSSSEIISGITQKITLATGILVSLVTVATSAILFVTITVALLLIDPIVATVAMISFGACYSFIAWRTRQKLLLNSQHIAREQTQVVKVLQEGLGAIRDVLLDGTQAVYGDVYSKSVFQLQRASCENSYIGSAPRYVMETLGMVLIAVLAFVLNQKVGGIGAVLPVLAALALGAQRLLPLMQQLYINWSSVAGSQGILVDVLSLLDQPLPEDVDLLAPSPVVFQDSIRFENVTFHYGSHGPVVLDGINLTIPKGSRTGFVGSTGSGKSTALDLLMALLDPVKGNVLVDDQPVCSQNRRTWQRMIAHVPQSIYLADASIAENIAFGVPREQIDMNRVRRVAKQAQISEFIESRSEGYGARVGERGIRLSGGQRQRIGIARALYKQAKVLVFDEATSALDNITENEVMSAIEHLEFDLTILLVAHRLTTFRYCDNIVRLEGGRIVSQGTYRDFMANNNLGLHPSVTTAEEGFC